MGKRGHDPKKERYWRRAIREAAQSGLSIREFCRQQEIKESRFHWWQRKLKDQEIAKRESRKGATDGPDASFALISDSAGELGTHGIELVLKNGRRVRIGRGVDKETLRTVLEIAEAEQC